MIQLNMQDKRPIYIQLVDGIKEQVMKGMLKPGDKILSIRQMAALLTVTPNTVSKAYQELERQKIIVSVKGKGNFINEIQHIEKNESVKTEIRKLLHQLCVE